MTTSPAPATPPTVTPPIAPPPAPSASKGLKVMIGLFLGVVLLLILSTIQKKKPEIYDLAEISYGKILVFEIPAGHSAKLKMTNDYCPVWASDPIKTYDDNGTERILDKGFFTEGPIIGGQSFSCTFRNKTKNSITIKTGKCVSQAECTLHF